MPRRKASDADPVPVSISVDSLTQDLIKTLNASGDGTKAYLFGDHREHTTGIVIPSLAFQWLIGGVNVLPIQRCIGISGLPKSFKSTLNIEIGNWFLAQNGIHVVLDAESKTSATMLEAMVRRSPDLEAAARARRIFKEVTSIERWQEQVVASVKFARKVADRPVNDRVPIYISIDSLNGRSSELSQERIQKDGYAEDRGFPVEAMKITRFFKALSLAGTISNLGYVQHLVQDLSAGPGYHGPSWKESGAIIAAYQSSIHLRVTKGKALPPKASHPFAPLPGVPVEGYTLWLTAERSCLGPDRRTICVDVLWQYEMTPQGPKQYLWYDWPGSLGHLIFSMKYDEHALKHQREALDQVVHFAAARSNRVNCEELGLENATLSEFGAALESHPEIRKKLDIFLGIVMYSPIQSADITPFLSSDADETENGA